ncbi:hypothetical protein DRO97_00320 [Archaeoglobales archaeon]|nr:MAG: hypothetical protein DRO97_00320 [Archaeoglobales archaeon]
MKAKVIIGKVNNYGKVDKFIEEVFNEFRVKFDNETIVKPNFLKFDDPSNGCITHPKVIEAVVRVLKDKEINPTIAEGGFWRDAADKCFSAFKLKEIAKCVNLNKEEFVRIKANGKALKDVKIAKTAFKALNKPFISLPKLKVHGLTKATLGIKNNMGFLKKPAIYMHFKIHQKLVDLLKLFNPALTIIDGVVGGNSSEMLTKPVKHGVIVASNSVIAADAIAASLMGLNAKKIEHIKLASQEYNVDLDFIEVNENVEELKINYSLSFIGRGFGMFGT